MTPLDIVLARLGDYKKSAKGFTAKCPAHGDTTPSLSISEGADGKVLLHCHAGCSLEAILGALGLTAADLFSKGSDRSERKMVATYDYTDEAGNLLFQVVRYYPKDFRQRRPDGDGGWIYNLEGARRVLYRLPQLLMADTVYGAEGEKDADRLCSLGISTTTSSQGAGKWQDSYSEALRGKHVVLLPDNDDPGEKHMQSVARSVLPVAASVKIVRLPGLPPKGDVSDWLDAGHTKEDLAALVEATPPLKPDDLKQDHNSFRLTSLGDLLNEPEESVSWLVDGLLPMGGFSLLVAKPKAGKTTLARNLALAVARGQSFLTRATHPGAVIYLALEEKRSEVRKHFHDLGAIGTEAIFIHVASAPADALEQLRTVAQEKIIVLVIIDPLFRFTRVKDGNDYAQVSAALEPLLVLARETGAHVLVVHHAGKGEREGGDVILGSTAIFAAVDTALIMRRTERYRTLQSIQRYGEDLPETVLKFDPMSRAVTLGESKEGEEASRLKDAILSALQAQEDNLETGHPLTEAELNEEIEGRTAHKRKALRELYSGDTNPTREHGNTKTCIARIGKGGKSDPFRYCLKDSRFLVPPYSREHGNTNPKANATSQESSGYSCSRDSGIPDEEAQSWEHENGHGAAAWETEL